MAAGDVVTPGRETRPCEDATAPRPLAALREVEVLRPEAFPDADGRPEATRLPRLQGDTVAGATPPLPRDVARPPPLVGARINAVPIAT